MVEMAVNLGQILNQPVRAGAESLSTDSLRNSAFEKTTSSQEKAVAEPESETEGESSDAKEVSDFKRILKRRMQDQNNTDSQSPEKEPQSTTIDQQMVTSHEGQAGISNQTSDPAAAQPSTLNPASMIRADYLAEQSQAASHSNSKQDYVRLVHNAKIPAPAETTKVLDSNILQNNTEKQVLTGSAENTSKADNAELQSVLTNKVNKVEASVIAAPQIKAAKDAIPAMPTGQSDNLMKINGVVVGSQSIENKTLYNQALQNQAPHVQAAQNQTEQTQPASPQIVEVNGLKKNTIQNLYKQQSSLIEKIENPAATAVSESGDALHNKTALSIKNVAYDSLLPHPAHQISTHNVANINLQNQTGDVLTSQVTGNQPVQSSSSTLFQKPIEQVLNAIPTTITGSAQQIRVSLSPEELGAVRITFRQQDEQIEGLIEIQNNEVRKDIEKSIPQIAAALAESGVTVRRIEIVPMQNSSQQQNESFSQGFSAADQQHLAGQANYNTPRASGSSMGSASLTSQQSAATPSSEKDYDPNALNMYA